MSKKIFIVLFMIALVVMPTFAAITGKDIGTDGKYEAAKDGVYDGNVIPTSIVAKMILFVLAFGGAILLLKGSWELVHALTHQGDDPRGVTKAVVNMVLGIVILVGFFGIMFYVFPNLSGGASEMNLTSGSNTVLSGLSGAIADIDPEMIQAVQLL